jgi:uncharacterized protein (DUF433 family)
MGTKVQKFLNIWLAGLARTAVGQPLIQTHNLRYWCIDDAITAGIEPEDIISEVDDLEDLFLTFIATMMDKP